MARRLLSGQGVIEVVAMARRLLSGQGVIEVVAKSRGEGRRLLSQSGEHQEASGTLGPPVFKRQRRGVHPGERTGAEELGGEPRIFCHRRRGGKSV